MASNNDNPRSCSPRPEDNPFIVFRRFADAQVSSLLNSILSIPSVMAERHDAQKAYEPCLFSKADRRSCETLNEIESDMAKLRRESTALFGEGDVQAVLLNAERLMGLQQQAQEVRRGLLGDRAERDAQVDLVQRVGNHKGQEWGWSHSWGWPIPFDAQRDDKTIVEPAMRQEAKESDSMAQLPPDLRDWIGEKAFDDTMAAFTRFLKDDLPGHDLKRTWDHDAHEEDNAKCPFAQQVAQDDAHKPRAWTWSRSWQWPPPADSLGPRVMAYSPECLDRDRDLQKAGIQWHEAYKDLLRTQEDEGSHCTRSHVHDAVDGERWRSSGSRRRSWEPAGNTPKSRPQEPLEAQDEPSYEYAHDHEDQHDEPPSPKADRNKTIQQTPPAKGQLNRDAQAQELEQTLARQRHATEQFWTRLGQSAQARHEETSRYATDATQAHHEPHAASQAPRHHHAPAETELDAYEHLLEPQVTLPPPPSAPSPPALAAHHLQRPAPPCSVLSTLTTTERTVAPDGSVTTKVVLKKRFADGREESSETVHTQRGREEEKALAGPWEGVKFGAGGEGEGLQRIGHGVSGEKQDAEVVKEGKRAGWFWSS